VLDNRLETNYRQALEKKTQIKIKNKYKDEEKYTKNVITT
jgi:hypothetical protein